MRTQETATRNSLCWRVILPEEGTMTVIRVRLLVTEVKKVRLSGQSQEISEINKEELSRFQEWSRSLDPDFWKDSELLWDRWRSDSKVQDWGAERLFMLTAIIQETSKPSRNRDTQVHVNTVGDKSMCHSCVWLQRRIFSQSAVG